MALRRFIPEDLASRAATLSFVANIFLGVLKLSVAMVSGSLAILSDGIDSAEDVFASGITVVSVRIGAKPADLEHPYGHGRYETLAAGLQAMLIGIGGGFIVFHSIQHLADPPDSIDAGIGIAAEVIAAIVSLFVGAYSRRVARITGSPAIAADAKHLWTNIVQASTVITGLVLTEVTGDTRFDAAVALLLGFYLLWTSLSILRSAAADVLDASLTEQEIGSIEEAILSEGEAISGYHRLRTRRSGQSRHVDFHLILPPDLTLKAAHDISERIEARIDERLPGTEVTVHMEPADGRFTGPRDTSGASRGREGEQAP
jgi:cation diffusion facilitator family transporter